MQVISEPNVFEEFGSEVSWFGESRHADAHGEFGDTCIEDVKFMSMNSDRTDVTARMAML